MYTNISYKFHISTGPFKVLLVHDNMKKNNYLKLWSKQRQHFTSFIVSIDGIPGLKSTTLVISLSLKFSLNCQQPYLHMCGYLMARMPVPIFCSIHWYIHRSKFPCINSNCWFTQLEGGAGLGILLRYVKVDNTSNKYQLLKNYSHHSTLPT